MGLSNPIMRVHPLDLITSQRTHFLIPSPGEMGFQYREFGGTQKHPVNSTWGAADSPWEEGGSKPPHHLPVGSMF